MAANSVRIEIDDRTKRLSFDEALTTGSTYAVEVVGGAAACGRQAVLAISTQDGDELASCSLAYGKGTLGLDTQAVADALHDVPFGAAFAWHALLRSLDPGEQQNVAVGDVQVVAAPYPTPSRAAHAVAFVGTKGGTGKKGEKGDKGDPAHITKMRTEDGKWHNVRVVQNGQTGDAAREYVVEVEQEETEGDGTFDALVKTPGSPVPRPLSERFGEIVNVRDFGALGDGVHDDTDAIQAAINYTANNLKGGTVFFPFTGKPYMLKKPPIAYRTDKNGNIYDKYHGRSDASDYDGRLKVRAQLYIPEGNTSVALVGEMPPIQLKDYHVPSHERWRDSFSVTNVVLQSTVDPWDMRPQGALDDDTPTVEHDSAVAALLETAKTSYATYREYETPVMYNERPWCVVACPQANDPNLSRYRSPHFSNHMVSMRNIEIRVKVHRERDPFGRGVKLFPTMGAVNFSDTRRMYVENCFFGLDNVCGERFDWSRYQRGIDKDEGQELSEITDYNDRQDVFYKRHVQSEWGSAGWDGQSAWSAADDNRLMSQLVKNPTNTVGLLGTSDDNAENKIANLTVQGFKYGVVLPEMTSANFLHISDTEFALCFMESTHTSLVVNLSTHNNRRYICALPAKCTTDAETATYKPWGSGFGTCTRYATYNPQINLTVLQHDYEVGHFENGSTLQAPYIDQMSYGVWDPENRINGSVVYQQGYPGDRRNDNVYKEKDDSWSGRVLTKFKGLYFLSDHCMYDHRQKRANGDEVWIGNVAERISDAIVVSETYPATITLPSGVEIENPDAQPDNADLETWTETASEDAWEDANIYTPEAWNAWHPACPRGYVAPDYGSYYPVKGGAYFQCIPLGARLAYQRTKDEPVVVSYGYAMRRDRDDSALVLIGGTNTASIENEGNGHGHGGRLTLYGPSHGSNAKKAVLSNGDGKNLSLYGQTLEWTGARVFGAAFAKAGMPAYSDAEGRCENGVVDLSENAAATQQIPATGTYDKSGWFTFLAQGVEDASARIVVVVKNASGGVVCAGESKGAGTVALSLPVPAGCSLTVSCSGITATAATVNRIVYCESN